MFISQLGLKPDAIHGETVIVTGAGGGIGYEAARALLWLGANVVIAEINQQNGCKAEVTLEKEFSRDRVLFVTTDVGDEASVKELYKLSVLAFGKVDAVINNATIAVLGNVLAELDTGHGSGWQTHLLRRRIHRHPEIGLSLPRTQAAVLESLDESALAAGVAMHVAVALRFLEGAKAA